MALVEQVPVPENTQDITRNLPTLTFESALDDDEISILHIRQQSHAHTVVTCSTISFFVSVLNEARQIRADLSKTSKQRRAIQLLTADHLPRDPLDVGIIGCGRIGTYIANSLLKFGDVEPQNLYISTRRPETRGELISRGVPVFYDNVEICKRVHLLIICILPCQLSALMDEIKPHVTDDILIYSIVNNVAAEKFSKTLSINSMIVPDVKLVPKSAPQWNSYMSIAQSLEKLDVLSACCPVTEKAQASCVHLTLKWVELAICAFVNMCTDLKLNSEAALDLLHGVVFGLENYRNIKNRLTQLDFIINWNQEDEHKPFPRFNLTKIHSHDSKVIKKLRASPDLQQAFSKKFVAVFDNVINQKRYDLSEPGSDQKL